MTPLPFVQSILKGALLVVALLLGVYWAAQCVYLLYFHPLAKFPGPKFAAISEIPATWRMLGIRTPFIMVDLHRKYGDVVRIRPNELSFATPQAIQDIYGHRTKGRAGQDQFLKTDMSDDGSKYPRLTAVRDPAEHARVRRSMSHAFSAKALRAQEDVLHRYLDMFVQQLERLGESGEKALNMSDAYNWITFDIISDLAFGESFDAVANGRTHPWVTTFLQGLFYGLLTTPRKRLPLLGLVLPFLVPRDMPDKLRRMRATAHEKARRRLDQGGHLDGSRQDFFDHMIQRGQLCEGELVSQGNLLIMAGSETTATFLTGVTYYLLKSPACLARLRAEVDGAFGSYGDITGDATAALPYLHAVIEEGLRLFPPVPISLLRYSPGASVDGHWVPAGTSVATQPYVLTRDPRYWARPDDFVPERWLPDTPGFEADDRRASQPFSVGPRGCLGINLAYLEMQVILSKLVWAFEWELASEIEDWNGSCKNCLLWLKPELNVKFHPRAHAD